MAPSKRGAEGELCGRRAKQACTQPSDHDLGGRQAGQAYCDVKQEPMMPSSRLVKSEKGASVKLEGLEVQVKREIQEEDRAGVRSIKAEHGQEIERELLDGFSSAVKHEVKHEVKCEVKREREQASSSSDVKSELKREVEKEPGQYMDCKPMAVYVVDNSKLEATDPGLQYFTSKDLESPSSEMLAAWGSIVMGYDEHDGWLDTEHGYLPTTWKGQPVLTVPRDSLAAVSFMELLQLNPILAETPPVSTNMQWYAKELRLMRSRYSSIRLCPERPLQSTEGLHLGSKVQVLSDLEVVQQACRQAELSAEDESKCKSVCGKVAWVLSTVDAPGMYEITSEVDPSVIAAAQGSSEARATRLEVGQVVAVQEITCSSVCKQLLGRVDGSVCWIPVLDLVSGHRWASRQKASRDLVTCVTPESTQGAPYIDMVLPLQALTVAEETPLQSPDKIKPGDEVQVMSDIFSVLEACRAVGIPCQRDGQRLAALGNNVRAIVCDARDNTVQCAIPEVGRVWFAAGALTTGPFHNGRAFRDSELSKQQGGKFKHEVQLEQVKREGEVQQEVKNEQGEVTGFLGLKQDDFLFGTNIRLRDIEPKKLSFVDRIPLWIKQCIAFQKKGKRWTHRKPCCMSNFFIEPMSPPPKGQLQSCFHRLAREQKNEFRAFVESGEADLMVAGKATWGGLLHPELAAEKARLRLTRPSLWEHWPWMSELLASLWLGCSGLGGAADGNAIGSLGGFCPLAGECFEGKGRKPRATLVSSACHEDLGLGGDIGNGVLGSMSVGKVIEVAGMQGAEASMSEKTDSASLPYQGSREGHCKLKLVRRRAGRQSGVGGVNWKEDEQLWRVRSKSGQLLGRFCARDYMAPGVSFEQAVDAALQEAIAHRGRLVEQGVLPANSGRKMAQYRSDVPGVGWHKQQKAWMVQLRRHGKYIHFERLKPKDDTLAEVERARLLAEARLRELAQQHGFAVGGTEVSEARAPEELLEVKSGEACIKWDKGSNDWHVFVQIGSKKINNRFRPQDLTPKGVECARLDAIRCRDALIHIQKRAREEPEIDVTPLIEEVRAEAKLHRYCHVQAGGLQLPKLGPLPYRD